MRTFLFLLWPEGKKAREQKSNAPLQTRSYDPLLEVLQQHSNSPSLLLSLSLSLPLSSWHWVKQKTLVTQPCNLRFGLPKLPEVLWSVYKNRTECRIRFRAKRSARHETRGLLEDVQCGRSAPTEHANLQGGMFMSEVILPTQLLQALRSSLRVTVDGVPVEIFNSLLQ